MKHGGKRFTRRGNTTLILLITLLSTVMVLIGCSGGGGGSSSGSSSGSGSSAVTALKVGERVSVVDAGDSQSSQIASLSIATAVSALPSNSDYNTDESHTYVEERSSEGFDIINEILCMMAQTAYDDMLNQGNYKAMIDTTSCGSSKDSASGAGEASQNQSSGANATEYEYWTVNSSRADNDSAQIVKVWIHEKEQDYGGGDTEPAKTIFVQTTITESKSATNPYGIFTLNFSGKLDSNGQEMMTGYLKAEREDSGEVLLKFYESGQHGQGSGSQQVTLNRSNDGSDGTGSISMTESWGGNTNTKTFDIAYSDGYFLRGDGTDSVCMNRNNTSSSVWRYGIYQDEDHASPGSRVTINSGFPIKYTNDGGTTYHGWVGFHGLWIHNDITVPDGATIYKQDFSGGESTETAYTMSVARGKLRRHMKKTITLEDITGVPISWNNCSETSPGQWTCQDTRVTWDGTNFVMNAVRSDQTNWMWQDITEANVTLGQNDWDFSFWSESLGGNGRINLMDNQGQQITLSDATPVVFHVEDTVFPGDTVPTTLACFQNCPDPSLINSQGEPFFTKSTWQNQNNFEQANQSTAPGSLVAGTNYIEYAFNTTSMELEYSSTPVVMTQRPDGVQWGSWSGAMFDPSYFADLACDWDPDTTCAFKAWDVVDVFYTWETGLDSWNRLTILEDSNGDPVSFDPPLNVEYTHVATGAKYFLEYNGFGDLHGIPGKCVDEDTGDDVPCWTGENDERFIRWVPEISVPDASTVTDAVSSLTYYVKSLDKEVRMIAENDTSACTTAGLSLIPYDLPDSSLYEDPAIGTEPTVTDAPAVISGVVQE